MFYARIYKLLRAGLIYIIAGLVWLFFSLQSASSDEDFQKILTGGFISGLFCGIGIGMVLSYIFKTSRRNFKNRKK